MSEYDDNLWCGYCEEITTWNISGSGTKGVCMSCQIASFQTTTERENLHMLAVREQVRRDEVTRELDEMYERIAKPHAQRMMKELEAEADKKFNILKNTKHDLGSIFS